MRPRWSIAAVIIIGLALIGFGRLLWENTSDLLIVIVLVGLVVLLYKYPPKRYRHSRPKKPGPTSAARPAKRKTFPFQVINGTKGEDDDLPKYH